MAWHWAFWDEARTSFLSDLFPHLSHAYHPGQWGVLPLPKAVLILCHLHIRSSAASHWQALSGGIWVWESWNPVASSQMLRLWLLGSWVTERWCQDPSVSGTEGEADFLHSLGRSEFPFPLWPVILCPKNVSGWWVESMPTIWDSPALVNGVSGQKFSLIIYRSTYTVMPMILPLGS